MATDLRRSKSRSGSGPQPTPWRASTRDDQSSRIHRKLLKTLDWIPLYPRRFLSQEPLLRMRLKRGTRTSFPVPIAATVTAVLPLFPHSPRRQECPIHPRKRSD